MKYYFYLQQDNTFNGRGNGECLTEGIRNIEVTKETYNLYKPDFFIWDGQKIIENPRYEEIERERQRQAHIKELKEQLDALDLKTIRALRAIDSGMGTEDDVAYLKELEAEAQRIRREIQG